MSAEIFRALVSSAMSVSLAIVIVAIARWPVRKLAGSTVAYSLWLLVPGSLLVLLLPSLDHELQLEAVRPLFQLARPELLLPAAPTAGYLDTTLLAIWILGFACSMGLVIHQHRRLMGSLGTIRSTANGAHQSSTASDPMVLGILRPRIVLPADFSERYSPEEQSLILMHEQVHLNRRDTAVNALATLISCAYWFNPLVFWAIRRYRLDQEISVDCCVVQARQKRSTYGEMLLNVQLAAQHRPSAFISSWSPRHPLKERLQMLKVPAPGKTRRRIGVTVVGALLVAMTQQLWSAQAPAALFSDSSLDIASDRTSVVTDGVVFLSGHIKLKAVDPSAPLQFSSDSVREGADGWTFLEGNVQLTLGQLVIKTSKASVQAGTGSIEMDEAYLIRLK